MKLDMRLRPSIHGPCPSCSAPSASHRCRQRPYRDHSRSFLQWALSWAPALPAHLLTRPAAAAQGPSTTTLGHSFRQWRHRHWSHLRNSTALYWRHAQRRSGCAALHQAFEGDQQRSCIARRRRRHALMGVGPGPCRSVYLHLAQRPACPWIIAGAPRPGPHASIAALDQAERVSHGLRRPLRSGSRPACRVPIETWPRL